MRRALLLAAALAIPASGVAVGLTASQAFAKSSGPNGKVTCTGINGTESGTVTVSGCTGSGSFSGSASTDPTSVATLAGGGTIEFTNSATSIFGAASLGTASAKKCPGYSKSNSAAENPSAETFTGSVTGGTAGLKVPGTYKGAVCLSSSGVITDLKPLKAS